MKKEVPLGALVAVIALVVVVLGMVAFRQFVYAAPTPHPNRGVNTGTGQVTTGPTNPG